MSDSSSLSSAPPSDDETHKPQKTLTLKKGKLTAGRPRKSHVNAHTSPDRSPSPPLREASPPHEYVLADNPDIAVLVAFRARFHEAFPKHVPNVGPQDIEAGIVGDEPSEYVEVLLCAVLALVLNRKKVIERGHHGRALEEAIQTQKPQWPTAWNGINPLHGNQTFATMNAIERLTLLKTLVIWSLNTSEVIGGIIRESYKQARREDDVNQPLSVQPWGSDGRKRRYWLIEGQNDTPFRVYMENQPKLVKRSWWSVAGTMDELKVIRDGLVQEGGQADRRMAEKIMNSVPRLEQSEEKRKRREYKKTRKAAFTRPEPGFSLYEGRTRGKRMKYTFSDDEETGSDAVSTRRSTRQSNQSTPAEFNGPTVTSSGRQVRSRFGRTYGEPLDTTTNTPTDGVSGDASESSARLRGGNGGARRSNRGHNTDQPRTSRRRGEHEFIDNLDDEDEAATTGNEWGGDDDDIEGKLDVEDKDDEDEENEADDESVGEADDPQSLIVQLKYGKIKGQSAGQDTEANTLNGPDSPPETAANLDETNPAQPATKSTITSELPPTQIEPPETSGSSLPQEPETPYPEHTASPQLTKLEPISSAPHELIGAPLSNLPTDAPPTYLPSDFKSFIPLSTPQHTTVNGNSNGVHHPSSIQADVQQNHVNH